MKRLSKMALLKTISATLLLTFLTGCKKEQIPADFPERPKFTFKVPVVEQEFCDADKKNCEVLSMCREYELAEDGATWKLLADHPLKKCHGVFGLTSTEVKDVSKFVRDAENWIKHKCGVNHASDSETYSALGIDSLPEDLPAQWPQGDHNY